MLTSAQPSSLENMPVIQLLSGLEDIGAVDPPSMSVEVSINLTIWLAPHFLCIPQRPLSYLMRMYMYVGALHNVLMWTHLIVLGTRLGLSLSRGGLGLRSLTQHSPAAYIASLCSSSSGSWSQRHHLASAIHLFNSSVPPSEAINSEVLLLTPVTQKSLSSKLDDHLFKVLLGMSSVADKARLLSVSSPHAASWLSVTPSEGLGLILTLPNFRLPLSGGLSWTFPMVLAAHCALRLS